MAASAPAAPGAAPVAPAVAFPVPAAIVDATVAPAAPVVATEPAAAASSPVDPPPSPLPVAPAPSSPGLPARPAQRPRPQEPGPGRPVAGRPGEPVANGDAADPRPTCTAAQLRRFIKSRPWVPLHELRRRFAIAGDDDEVTLVRVGGHQLFVGLPPAEGRMLGELLGSGEIGYELGLDPGAPIVVGVYPMRPVPRA